MTDILMKSWTTYQCLVNSCSYIWVKYFNRSFVRSSYLSFPFSSICISVCVNSNFILVGDLNLQPEMEMVARGLEKNLKLEQREFLMNMLVGFCDEESRRSAAEALGLVSCFSIFAFLFVKPNADLGIV